MRVLGTDFSDVDRDTEGIDTLIDRGMREIVARVHSRLGDTLTASSHFSVSQDDVDVIRTYWPEYVDEVLIPFLTQVMLVQSTMQADRFFQALAFEILPLDADTALDVYVTSSRNRLVGIGDELWMNARDAIAEGVSEGESIPEISARIQESIDVTAPRSRVIARTEVLGARNAASFLTAQRAGVGMDKEWISTPDDRTRESHIDAGGQIVGMNDSFTVGTASLRYPGDPDGPPEEVIQCRCTIAYVVSDSETSNTDNLVSSNYQEGENMPYEVVEGHSECGSDAPWAVVKEDDGEVMGCHESQDAAQAQQAALYAAEEEDNASSATGEVFQNENEEDDSERRRTNWSGVLAVEGSPTGDGREFSPESIDWPNPADVVIPLQWQKETTHGGMHDVTVNVGRVTEIYRDGNSIMGSGYVDTGSEDGGEVQRRMEAGTLAGVSIVADNPDDPMGFDVEYVMDESCEIDPDDPEGNLEDVDMRCLMPEKVIYHSGRIRALTLVDVPAYVEGSISLTTEPRRIIEEEQQDDDDEMSSEALLASALQMSIPEVPPAEWFTEPVNKPEIGAITITDEGQIFGYLAPKNVAHRGISDRRQTVPMGNVDYSRYMNRPRHVETYAGVDRIATGPITMGCGHASTAPGVDAQASMDHYDNACSIVATVRIGENRHGVWVAGALMPDVEPRQVMRMMACQLSGDWRPHREKPGKRDFTGALLVPVPGFAEGKKGNYSSIRVREGALVSSAVPVLYAENNNAGEVQPVRHKAFTAAAQVLAKDIGRDKQSRLAEMKQVRG